MDFKCTVQTWTPEGYKNTYRVIYANSLSHAKQQATRWANETLPASVFADGKWHENESGDSIRPSDNIKSDQSHRDYIILRRVYRASEEPEPDEILTPTEKLKELRNIVTTLTGELGLVVTYDDNTTENLLRHAENSAVAMLRIIYDNNLEDILHSLNPMTGVTPPYLHRSGTPLKDD